MFSLAWGEVQEIRGANWRRQFASWTMGKIRLDKINRSLLLKYSATGTLNPYDVSGCATVAMLEELVTTAAFTARD